ncbi:hypothetical protein [Azospirillum sp. ST 5-10]|uniref:hypothetical protein n=1 Tax=unclassified Azospirillum TaxID=2630922 RepID=UPI003F4A7276
MRHTGPVLAAVAGLALAAALPGGAAAQDAPARPAAVRVAGEPVLQLCRDWLMWDSCRQYGHGIRVPEEVRVGDTFVIAFASNAKRIRFTVAGIFYADGECHLIRGSSPQDVHPGHPVDMLIVRDCRPLE